MLSWIVRLLFIVAAPIAALLVSRDALNFGLVQTLVAIVLIVALVGLAAAWSMRRPRARP
jgi:predicted membrane channel-forming protein YqfA (hemolysin III family)